MSEGRPEGRPRASEGLPVSTAGDKPAITADGRPEAAETRPVIFLIPHQDDDVLSFGASMRHYVEAGRRSIAVLLTDGSGARVCMNQYTDADGIYDDTDRAECTARRDREFLQAMTTLGVEPVIRSDRARNGELTKAFVLRVMNEYLRMYPGASFKAQTYKESNWPGGMSTTTPPARRCEA